MKKKYQILKTGRESISADINLKTNMILNKSNFGNIKGGLCVNRTVWKCQTGPNTGEKVFDSTCGVKVGGDGLCFNYNIER